MDGWYGDTCIAPGSYLGSEVVSEFKPTWLVRISDMQVVPGPSVTEKYWALSYSWNQSGELVHKGGEKYGLIDDGKHQIIDYAVTVTKPGSKAEIGVAESAFTVLVTFEGLVQQICKDFGIDYIWFDQMCIDQDDHDAKMYEIRQMHLIYKNACGTLAFVPEILSHTPTDNQYCEGYIGYPFIQRSQWAKRMWTLEETYMSQRIVVVGHNVNFCLDAFTTYNDGDIEDEFFLNICGSRTKWRACTALWYAKGRTSSKAHDRIFAFVNIFPELKDSITFNYYQPIRDLAIQFYGLLAQMDPSVLAFGHPNNDQAADREITTIGQKEDSTLPSWIGAANGIHVPHYYKSEVDLPEAPSHYSINGECMSLTSEFVIAYLKPFPASLLELDHSWLKDRKYPDSYLQWKDRYPPCLPIYTEDSGSDPKHKSLTFVKKPTVGGNHTFEVGLKTTHVLPAEIKYEAAINTLSAPTHCLGVLSLTESSAECIILSKPKFKDSYSYGSYLYHFYPVLKKEKDHYKSIGLCFMYNNIDFSPLIQPEQTFLIL